MSNANAGTGKNEGKHSGSDALLTVNAAAALLSVKAKTVRSWVGAGHLPAVRLGPGGRGIIRIDPRDLDEFIEKNKAH